MIMQEVLGTDAARNALAFTNVAEFNSRVDWNLLGPALFALIVIAPVLVYYRGALKYLLCNNFITRWWERRQMRADREKKLREIISDNIQDAIDGAWLDKDITDEERQWAFESIGKLGFPDLRSKAMTLKDEIKARRAKEAPGKETELSHVHVL